MKDQQEPYAKEFIESMRHTIRCVWCRRDGSKRSQGFCRHCNKVRKDLEKVEKQVQEQRPEEAPSSERDCLKLELETAREQKKDCIEWGKKLDYILSGFVDSQDLAGWFRLVAKRIARDEGMHFSAAELLVEFTTEQRQVLAYMFWEIFGAEASRKRRNRAEGRAERESLRPGVKQSEDGCTPHRP
jgi:hypothetical protein